MTTHDTYLQLAATAVDYPLAASERTRLEAHLAACPACARRAHAFRGDALALGHLPRVTLPERRGSEILAAALHPGVVRHPVRLLVLAALLGLLLVGSLAVGAQLLRTPEDELSVIVPVPSASPGPEDLTRLAWVRQGDAPSGSAPEIVGVTGEIVGFAGGYVARHQGPGVYFSPDGRAWREVLLPPLGIEGARKPYIAALASSGAQVLAVGGYGHDPCRSTETGEGPACEMSPMAWVTDDGVTWRPSDPWALPPGVAEPEWGADASAAWAVPGGWEAARVSWEGAGQHPVDIWRSADGIRWERVAALESPGINQGHGVAVAGDGTRVRWDSLRIPAEGVWEVQSLLRTSADGATWTELGTFPGADVSITRVAPPIPGQRSTWVVAGSEIHFDEGGGIGSLTPRIWTSSDLSTWTAADLEVPDGARSGIYGLTWSHDRLVAVDGTGLTWVSPDGSSWTLLADRRAVGLIADGPAGIIGMPEPGWDGDEGIWLLSPTAEPASLPTPSPTAEPLGRTWVEATVPVVVDRPIGIIEAMAAGGPGFVAVGRGCIGEAPTCEAIVWTSANGRAWVRAPASDATNIGAYFATSGPEIGMFDVTAGDPGIVAIGYAARPDLQATTWFSPDGTTWERIPLGLEPPAPSPGGFNGARVNAVTWDGRQFVIVGEDRSDWKGFGSPMATATARAAVWTSPDGRTWTRVPHAPVFEVGEFIDTTEDPSTGGMADVMAGPDGLIAVGSVCNTKAAAGCEPALWTSPDGSSWERLEGVPTVSGSLGAIATSDTRTSYVAVGAGTVLTSRDGMTWLQQPVEQPNDFQSITWIGDRFFATVLGGPATVWASEDGSAWAPAAVEGGPAADAQDATAHWHFAATPDVAAWVGMAKETDDPVAWVSVRGTAP